MSEYDKLIASAKDHLPTKAKCDNYPQILWIEAPQHDNIPTTNQLMRTKFNAALNTAASFHDIDHVLQLKKVWDPHSLNLFLKEEKRFTSDGLIDYWLAVDKTVKYANTILFKKIEKKKEKKATSGNMPKHDKPMPDQRKFKDVNCYHRNDKFHWYRNRAGNSRHYRDDHYY